MVVDGAELSAELMATVVDECPVAGPEGAGKLVERIWNKAGGESVGAYVSMPRTEYEFGEFS